MTNTRERLQALQAEAGRQHIRFENRKQHRAARSKAINGSARKKVADVLVPAAHRRALEGPRERRRGRELTENIPIIQLSIHLFYACCW